MATPASYPVAKSFILLTKEVTEGTAVPPGVATVPVNKFLPKDRLPPIKDKAQRGSMAGTYGQQQGSGHAEWTIEESPVMYDMLPYFLNNILGDITTSGAGPYTHVHSLLNSGAAQPGTFTIFDWEGTPTNSGRQWPGIVVTELVIKGNPESEYITWSAKGLGWLSAAMAAAPVAAPTSDRPMPAWRAEIKINTVAVKAYGEWEITITREAEAEHTSQNSQQPYKIQRGELTATGSLAVRKPSDETQLQQYLANTQPALNIVADNGGLTTAKRSIDIQCSVIGFDDTSLDRGELAIGYKQTFEALANSTDAGASGGSSPIKITVINNTVGGTY